MPTIRYDIFSCEIQSDLVINLIEIFVMARTNIYQNSNNCLSLSNKSLSNKNLSNNSDSKVVDVIIWFWIMSKLDPWVAIND